MKYIKFAFILFPLFSQHTYASDYSLVNSFQSEVSGVLRMKLDSLGASASVVTSTMEAFSETSVSYASALAAEYGG
ncbi:hypothetical protein, partial [Escherichia coli]|uniref:hypothetical protein n=1 Tax=Escherichia coli TaxID=562 RepID=UPI0001E8A607